MTTSKLASGFVDVGKHYGRRTRKVGAITPHHMAGVMGAAQCARMHRDSAVDASANYYIGEEGEIVGGVAEENAAWTSASWANDDRAITIEVSNCEVGGYWAVSDAAWHSLVMLCHDICKRYGFRLSYTGDASGTLTEHRMFAATACPGPCMHDRMPMLAKDVNTLLDTNGTGYRDGTYAVAAANLHCRAARKVASADMGKVAKGKKLKLKSFSKNGKGNVWAMVASGAHKGQYVMVRNAKTGKERAVLV